MEILTYKKVYQLVGDNTSGTNECITKSAAVQIAESHRKNVTSNLSQYLNNEYIDVFAVEDKPDLSTFSFANNRYNPQAAGNTYTTAVSSRDIDGNTIEYNATADVDWITDIVINSTEIKFKVAANMGDQRTGHINGSNATGNSDTITIVQEAKEANLDYTYSLVATCTSVPTVTINGIAITRYTTAGNTYTFQYTTRVRTESEAPESVGFTISGGGAGDTYNEGTLSVSPTSWDLNDGLSKQFTVGYSRVKTTKAWDHATGTIARNGSTNVSLNTTTATEYPTIDYTISDTHPSGESFSHSKNGMNFTSAASSTSCTGSIIITYGSLSATANVFYTEPTYDSYTYTVKASDVNTSSTPTITINGQNTTVTHSDGYYIGKITISDSATTSAPDSVSWSISGGTKATEWGRYDVSLSPSSWNLDDGLTKEFSVSMYQSGTKYDWRTSSGTVAKNREVSTDVTSSSTSFTGSNYSISVPAGITFSKDGTSFTATASGTGSTGTITVTCTESDANGESASCDVMYNPALKSWTYTVNATCSERPTITIGGEDATVTGEINAWVGTRTIVAQEDPGEKDYYVTSGSSSRTWSDVHVSVNPSSVTITEKPKDISFTAYAYQEYEEYSAYTASGTTSNKRAACKPTRSYSTGTSSSETCNISADNVSGLPGSMSIDKDGTLISCTANGSGSVTVSYNYGGYSDSATFSITYNEQEIWPDWDDPSVTYVFQWTNMTESISANDIAYDLSNAGNFGAYNNATVSSYRTRTSSKGNPEYQDVGYTGREKGWPSGNNTSTFSRSDSGTLTQNNSGKTITWLWSQNGRPEEPTTGPYYSLITSSLSFTAEGGTQTARYKMYYLKEGVEVQAIELTHSVTVGVLYSEETRTWNESIDGTGLSIPCTQDRNTKVWKSNSPINLQFPAAGGTKEFTLATWYEWNKQGSDFTPRINSQTKSITAEPNQTTTSKSWSTSYEQDGQTINVYCTQDAETFPVGWLYVFTWNDGSNKIKGDFDVNGNEKSGGTYGSATAISYRTKTGTAGTIKKEDVSYSGSKESPSGVNMSDAELGSSGKLIQAGLNKTIEWQWSQDANEYVYGAECSAEVTYKANGEFMSITNGTVSLTRAFKYGDSEYEQYDTEDANYRQSTTANTGTSKKTWTESFTASNGAPYTVSCIQLGKVPVLHQDKTITISGSVTNLSSTYAGRFNATDTVEKDISVSYTIAYKKQSDQSYRTTSGSCVIGSGHSIANFEGNLPIGDAVMDSAVIRSISMSPSTYTNSTGGTTHIVSGI